MNSLRKNLCLVLTFALATGAIGVRAIAADDAKAIAERAAQSYVESFNQGDSAAVSELFTEDASRLFSPQQRAIGRQEISRTYEEFMSQTRGGRLQVEVEHAQQVADGVVVSECRWRAENFPAGTPTSGRAVVVSVKQGDAWKIAFLTTYQPAPEGGR